MKNVSEMLFQVQGQDPHSADKPGYAARRDLQTGTVLTVWTPDVTLEGAWESFDPRLTLDNPSMQPLYFLPEARCKLSEESSLAFIGKTK